MMVCLVKRTQALLESNLPGIASPDGNRRVSPVGDFTGLCSFEMISVGHAFENSWLHVTPPVHALIG